MLVVIPARGGSKGVPDKNIKLLGGKPLIQYTIEAAREIFSDDQILVSTDSKQIKEVVEGLGLEVPFLRPPELATDHAGTNDVIRHALNFVKKQGSKPKVLVLLQPTSPFRNAEHIKEALKHYSSSLDMLVSVKETSSNPYYVLREENEKGYLVNSKQGNFTRRQDCPKVWELNGAIYIINVDSFKSKNIVEFQKVKKFVMDEFSSHDIDDEFDWLMAQSIIALKQI